MGVQGLWSIIYTSGTNIDLTVLEGKTLAIDMSIWLNQALKTSIDIPNPHLQLLFRRICKLLFYKIKPVFVFDGPSPTLKKRTIDQRKRIREIKNDQSEKIKNKVIQLLLKKEATQTLKRKQQINIPNTTIHDDDIFNITVNKGLDDIFNNEINSDFVTFANEYVNNFESLEDVDINSDLFYSMPLEVQHEVLRYIAKEKRYRYDSVNINSKNGQEFSNFQMKRLLERSNLQKKIEDVRDCINYKNKESLILDSGNSLLSNIPVSKIKAHKVLSHSAGYLMLIDKDDIDSLSNTSNQNPSISFKTNPTKLQNINSDDMALNNSDLANVMESASKLVKIQMSDNSNFKIQKKINIEDEVSKPKDTLTEYKNNHFDIVDNPLENERNNQIKNNFNLNNSTSDKEKLEYFNKIECENNEESDTESDDFISVEEVDDEKEEEIVKEVGIEIEKQKEIEKEYNLSDEVITLTEQMPYENIKDLKIKKTSIEIEDFNQVELDEIFNNFNKWESEIDESLKYLKEEEDRLNKQSTTINDIYYQDAKDLLKLFGIPYIESPGEAEAQCAFLEQQGLTNGTVTEDSDIWLFGGLNVYKHIFSKNMTPRHYNVNKIYKKLGLTRDLMICIALLSGSDYTPGIFGIGPVISMEILAQFSDSNIPQSELEVLESFKSWYDKHKNSKEKCNNEIRKRYLRFNFDEKFPDRMIFSSYKQPIVDESKEEFSWSQPKIEKLLELATNKLGWERLKAIETLQLIENSEKFIKRQKEITDYLTEDVEIQKLLPSKRLKLATGQRKYLLDKSAKCKKK